jgi:hypothetical protein
MELKWVLLWKNKMHSKKVKKLTKFSREFKKN